MHAAAVVSSNGTRGTTKIDSSGYIESINIVVIQRTCPCAGFVIKIVQRSSVAVWDDSHG